MAPPTDVALPPTPPGVGEIEGLITQARRAQQDWKTEPVRKRLVAISAVRAALVDDPKAWAEEITLDRSTTLADSLAAEVLPLADACRFLQRNAAKLLRDRQAPGGDRPIWGRGLKVVSRRAPHGVVLIIGAGNYPLFLAGVQSVQAITAGNAVLIKPAPGSSAPMMRMVQSLEQGGMPAGLVQILDESPAAAEQAIDAGVDHVVLTGSAETGRKVYTRAAAKLTPCTMELSGCDAVFVLPRADLERVADAIAFGLRLNSGATCIGPKRVYATKAQTDELAERLRARLPKLGAGTVPPAVAELAQRLVEQALDDGAMVIGEPSTFDPDAFQPIVLRCPPTETPLHRADLFASVVSLIEVNDGQHALELDRECPYALGTSVFGPAAEAEAFAARIEAGCVTVNDLVAPTADPRVAFGGWKKSGFGVTRGAEGLLDMTRPQTIVSQTARWLPHLDPPRPQLDRLIIGLLRMSHGKSLGQRWQGLRDVIAGSKK